MPRAAGKSKQRGLGGNKKGGSTQSRLNLTNHHYKEPEQDTLEAKINNGVITPNLPRRRTQGDYHRVSYYQVRRMPYTGSAGGLAGEAAGAPSVVYRTDHSVMKGRTRL